jgi:16S rRNA (adenine1518-N6/adenine1519-N6)-dimethyltransferase
MPTLYEEVRTALRELGLHPKKSRGQNFLIHERVIDSILGLLDLGARDEVVEVGPGLGFLTRRLLAGAGKVWAVEVDETLVRRLRQNPWAGDPKLVLVHGDILRVDLPGLLPKRRIKLAGNLPYSMATEILFRIFEWRENFSSLVVMVQKEVAERMTASPGTKDYGTLSAWCQLYGKVAGKIAVSPEAFFPRPKVRSTILKLELFDEPAVLADEIPALRGLVRAAFGQRRKTFANALAGWLKLPREEIEVFLRAQSVDPRRRGETLKVEEFIALARAARGQGLPIAEP